VQHEDEKKRGDDEKQEYRRFQQVFIVWLSEKEDPK
jgi:hypothetical protein